MSKQEIESSLSKMLEQDDFSGIDIEPPELPKSRPPEESTPERCLSDIRDEANNLTSYVENWPAFYESHEEIGSRIDRLEKMGVDVTRLRELFDIVSNSLGALNEACYSLSNHADELL